MRVTNRTRFCSRRPPIDFQHGAYPLFALVFEFLRELTKSKVRYLFPPKPFHTRKVQIFKEQDVKLTTEFYRQFPMVVCSLVRRFLVETGNVLAFSFLVVRPFDLARIRFLCVCQLLGILFVEHRRCLSVSVTGSQEVFDSKVEPFSFTRLGFGNDFAIVFSERDIHVSECVSCNLNLLDFSLDFTAQGETIPTSVETNTIRWSAKK